MDKLSPETLSRRMAFEFSRITPEPRPKKRDYGFLWGILVGILIVGVGAVAVLVK